MLTRDEVKGLMADLFVSQASPDRSGRLSEWVHQNAAELGQHYASEIARRPPLTLQLVQWHPPPQHPPPPRLIGVKPPLADGSCQPLPRRREN